MHVGIDTTYNTTCMRIMNPHVSGGRGRGCQDGGGQTNDNVLLLLTTLTTISSINIVYIVVYTTTTATTTTTTTIIGIISIIQLLLLLRPSPRGARWPPS